MSKGEEFLGTALSIERHETHANVFGQQAEDFLSFRLQITDQNGNTETLLPVEIRAKQIINRVQEGDFVNVVGKVNKQGVLIPHKIFNITSKSEIHIKKRMGLASIFLIGPLILLSIVGVIGFFGGLLGIVASQGHPEELVISIIVFIVGCICLGLWYHIGHRLK
ncbi:hypothetical protein [Methanococcoides methylutens]|uniref:hypothetical protein n=1 Tax=Methanococcoides methylutens TaxID=2226 RepID=UPI00065002FB|nr:hypothetical protein [Methanococcoides methylutens]